MKPCTDIAFCVDHRHLPHRAVGIDSIRGHLDPGPGLDFHIIYDGPPNRAASSFARRRMGPHRVRLVHPVGNLAALVCHLSAAAAETPPGLIAPLRLPIWEEN